MNHKMKTKYVTVIALFSAALRASAAIGTYTFDNLNSGALAGQDGWVSGPSLGSPVVVAAGTTIDTTKVATVAAGNNFAILVRQADGAFAFPSFTGSETAALLQFDFSWNRTDDNSSINFKIGRDLNSDNQLVFNESLGIRYQSGLFEFDTAQNVGPGASRTGVGAGNVGDLFRVRLLMDFTANSGQGSGVLSYENLTRGDTTFNPLASGSFLLGSLAPAAAPGDWNKMEIVVTSGAQFDNLTVGTVPEPSSVALLAMAGLALIPRRGRTMRRS